MGSYNCDSDLLCQNVLWIICAPTLQFKQQHWLEASATPARLHRTGRLIQPHLCLMEAIHGFLLVCISRDQLVCVSVCLIKTMCTGLKDELSPCSAVRGVFPCNASLAWVHKTKAKKPKSRNCTPPIFQVQPAKTQLFSQEEMPSGRGLLIIRSTRSLVGLNRWEPIPILERNTSDSRCLL